MNRAILHCDLNNFYASVECQSNQMFDHIPVAVAGNEAERTGIILAKNNIAKQFGVKTGEAIWQAKQKCSELVTVPPHFKKYCEYSKKAREIYKRYSDQVESFGIDECWLDVGDSEEIFGSAYKIANEIRIAVKQELGLTISIGISFNKIFAKLGSDMKKPDAITVIEKDNFKEKLWPLPVNDLLGVGRATKHRLNDHGIYTIGDIALSDWHYMQMILGKNGVNLWIYANGFDNSSVIHQDFEYEMKSIGNSTTCTKDITDNFDVWRVILCLSQEVCTRLKECGKVTSTIVLGIKTPDFKYSEHSIQLEKPSCMIAEISTAAMTVYMKESRNYDAIRAIGVRALGLSEESIGIQESMFIGKKIIPKFTNIQKPLSKNEYLESSMHQVQKKYGEYGITKATLLLEKNIPSGRDKGDFKLPNLH